MRIGYAWLERGPVNRFNTYYKKNDVSIRPEGRIENFTKARLII